MDNRSYRGSIEDLGGHFLSPAKLSSVGENLGRMLATGKNSSLPVMSVPDWEF